MALVREAGVDPIKLQTWSDVHLKLFGEAIDPAKCTGGSPGLAPSLLEMAVLLSRTDLTQEKEC